VTLESLFHSAQYPYFLTIAFQKGFLTEAIEKSSPLSFFGQHGCFLSVGAVTSCNVAVINVGVV